MRAVAAKRGVRLLWSWQKVVSFRKLQEPTFHSHPSGLKTLLASTRFAKRAILKSLPLRLDVFRGELAVWFNRPTTFYNAP